LKALRQRQRGVAILAAMLIVVLATIIAGQPSVAGRRSTSAASTPAIATDQGMLFCRGAEGWAGDILRQDLVDSPDSDNLAEVGDRAAPLPMQVGDRTVGTITGKSRTSGPLRINT
jgi:type II secretory pathway component PulK